MKKPFGILLFFFLSAYSFAQIPGVKWSKYYPNDTYDQAFFDIKAINGGGFVLAGGDYSGFYDKNRFLSRISSGRASLIKIDQDGNIIWNRSTGDSASYTSIQIGSDGSITAAGYSQNFPEFSIKYFIAKYDNNGTELWRRSYGNATGISRANSIMKTSDNGYILAGNTNANDGDVSGNHGSTDVWLLKLDDSGYVQWKKCYGGTGADSAYAVAETPDNGFVVAGSSTSSNGNLTGNNGLSDAWIFKVDNAGNLVWQKNIGGSGHENFKSLVVNSDSSFTLTGYTLSTTVTTGGNHGKRDLWVIKLSKTASIQWSKSFGGSQDDQGCSIQRTIGNGYLVGGYTESSNGDITLNSGGADAWLLNLTFDGSLIWQKTIGTNKDELGMASAYLTETDFAIGGFAQPTTPAAPWDHVDAILSLLGNTNIIKGILYYDLNSNTIKDPGEENFTLANVKTINGSFERISIPTDQGFLMYVDLGTFTTSVVLQSAYYTVVPSSYSSTFTTYFNTDSFSFAVQPIPGIKDLVINALPLNVARPGFSVDYKILYKNVGTATVTSGEVLFKKDPRLNFISSIPAISSSNGDTLKWSYSNLLPLDSSSITIKFNVQVPPQVNIGETLTSVGIITPVAGDQTPLDDTVVVKQVVVGSFDPNDKYEKNEGEIPPAYVADGKYLDYLVRFQNLGTDTAFNIVVLDTLSEKLDLSSLQVITTSHSYKVTLTGNVLAWAFNDILLPHSAINEPASHGYIAYRIKPLSSVAIGDTIHNTASIYFDFNLPVRTNKVSTVVAQAPPTITSLNPAGGGIGTAITITGTNFNGTMAVSFGGVAASSFTVNSSTSITAVVGTGASGSVSVATPGGTAALAGFIFIPAPTITSFTPTSGVTGTTITVAGTNLTGATVVSIGGVAASSFTVNSSTSITAVVATGASGSVSVTTPGGTAALAGFTFIPAPAITSFTPTSGSAGTSITITGTNLTGATAVNFGGVAASSFIVNSSTSITAVVGTGASGSVSVTTPGGTATLAGFTFVPAPTITSFTPTSGSAGTSITITGTNFAGATAVNFGGVAATSFTINSATSITAVVGAGASGNVSVITPGGTASLSGFTFIPAPAITSFTPTSGSAGTSITITGTNFAGATAVNFGGVAASSFTVNSSTSITAVVGTGASGNVSVTTPGGTASLSGFTFIPAPAITSFTPTNGSAGTSITITGTNFAGATAVNFGGVAASSFTVNSSTTITAIVGTGASGSVSVTTPGGTASMAGFTFNTVTGINGPSNNNTIELRIIPNPVIDLAVIKHPSTNKDAKIRFIDILGRTVKIFEPEKNTPQSQLDLRILPSGVYNFVWSDGIRTLSRTFMKK